MGWFVTQSRNYPSIAACAVGAVIGITLGNLVVPSADERIASGTYFVTTEAAGTPSDDPAPTVDGSPTGPSPTVSESSSSPTSEATGATGTPTGGNQTGDTSGGGTEPDAQADDEGRDAPSGESEETFRQEAPAQTSDPDDQTSQPSPTDEPDPPNTSDPPEETDEPDEPDDSDSPSDTPTPTPTDTPTTPPDKEERCLDLDLTLLELLLCLD